MDTARAPSGVASLRAFAVEHTALVAVLAGAALLRLLVLITYPGGLFFSDSYEYLDNAWAQFPARIPTARPVGYPLFLRIFTPGHHLAGVLVVQHLLGLVVAAVAYALLVHLRVRRSWAVVAAGLIAFEGYSVALEQHIMPEALTTALLICSLALAVWSDRPRVVALSGLLLAAAIVVRSIAAFVIPAWAVYVLLRHRNWRTVTAGALSLALPLVIYAAALDVKFGSFGLNAAHGWFLYGRVGPIADCRGVSVPVRERFLCTDSVQRPDRWATFYIFSRRSPLNRRYHTDGPFLQKAALAESNSLAESFSRRMIRAHPGAYARLVTADFLRYFRPAVSSHDPFSDLAFELPSSARSIERADLGAAPPVPDYKPEAGALAPALDRYVRIVHTPRWLLAILVLVSLAAIPLARGPGRRLLGEAWLFTGAALCMFAGSVIDAEFVVRYIVPAAPLLLIGGVLSGNAFLADPAGRASRLADRGQPSEAVRTAG